MISQQNVRNFSSVLCMLALLFVGERAMAQADQSSPKAGTAVAGEPAAPAASSGDSQPLPPEKQPPSRPDVEYSGQLLKIDAFNSTLADILTKIAELTGADIDVPASARGERMVADLGPGPPRQILTSLLTDTDFDFVITSSKGDPQSILTVLLTPRGHNNGSARDTVVAERPSPYFRRMPAERMRAAENAPDGQTEEEDSTSSGSESASADATSTEVPEEPSATAAASPAPESPAPARAADASAGQQTAQQSMNQQLLQMYKQREQQIQEQRTVVRP